MSKVTFRVISIAPCDTPKIKDGNPPALGRVHVIAMSGSQHSATLAWDTYALKAPRVGELFELPDWNKP